jgi:hypothetical protein
MQSAGHLTTCPDQGDPFQVLRGDLPPTCLCKLHTNMVDVVTTVEARQSQTTLVRVLGRPRSKTPSDTFDIRVGLFHCAVLVLNSTVEHACLCFPFARVV